MTSFPTSSLIAGEEPKPAKSFCLHLLADDLYSQRTKISKLSYSQFRTEDPIG